MLIKDLFTIIQITNNITINYLSISRGYLQFDPLHSHRGDTGKWPTDLHIDTKSRQMSAISTSVGLGFTEHRILSIAKKTLSENYQSLGLCSSWTLFRTSDHACLCWSNWLH